MIVKTATFRFVDIKPLNKPIMKHAFVKDQDIEPDGDIIAELEIGAELEADGDATHFDLEAEINSHPDSLFVKCFAIKADEMNDNGDYFEKTELRKATSSFVGVPVFTNHNNSDAEAARGKVVHSWWDDDKNGIMIIARVDAEAYPQLARGIKEEYIAGTSMGCFLGHNRVLMSDGTYCPIDEVQPGDEVITHKGNIKPIVNVQRHLDKENDEILHLNIRGIRDTIDVTKDHPFYVPKIQNKCACGCGKVIDIPNSFKRYQKRYLKGHYQTTSVKIEDIRNDFDYHWLPANELKVGDMVCVPRMHLQKTSISRDEARLIGLFLAEGSYVKRKANRVAVEFNFSLDEQYSLGKMTTDLLKSVFPNENKPTTQIRTDRNIFIVRLYSKSAAMWFFEKCGEYSHNKRLSADILLESNAILSEIIGCFIAVDGHLRKVNGGQNYNIWTTSHYLRDQFDTILNKLGIKHSTTVIVNGKSSTLRKAAGLESVSVDYEYVDTRRPSYCIQIGQSHSALLSAYVPHKSMTRFVKAQKTGEKFVTDDFILTPITAISRSYNSDPVYTLQVAQDNSYVVEGVAVKNCQVQYSLCSICHNKAETPDQYCFVGNTSILMSDFTTKNISDVKVGDEVIDAFGSPTKVTHTFKHKVKEKGLVLKSRTISGELVCTKNHPFLVYNRGDYRYCPAEFLTDNHILFSPVPRTAQDNSFFSKYGFSKLSDNQKLKLCKLLGYYAAEGSRIIRNNQIKAIEFCFHKDEKDFVDDVVDICQDVFGKLPSTYTKNVTRVRLWLPHVAQKIAGQICPGIVHKEQSKQFDSSIFSLSDEYLLQLLSAFIDGDGHCDKNGSIVINSACPGLAHQLYYLIRRIGLSPSINVYRNSGGPFNRDRTGFCHRISIGNSQVNHVANSNIGVKLYQANQKVSLQSKIIKSFTEDGLFVKHSLYGIDEVLLDEDVYNLETESHSYVANNTSVHNCEHIRERKTRPITAKKQKCQYHKNGDEDECPICGCKKGETKTYAVEKKAYEYNYGIKFIENSFVVNPACSECGVTEVIDPKAFVAKVAEIASRLPKLLKCASERDVMCSDKGCIKLAGQKEIEDLNQALDLLTSVSQSMLQQKAQIDLEFLSDLVEVLADLQTVTQELTEQGYGQLPSPGVRSGQEQPAPQGMEIQQPGVQPVNAVPGGGSKIQSGPAGPVGTVTSPSTAEKRLNLEKMAKDLLHKSKRIYCRYQIPRKRIGLNMQITKPRSIQIPFRGIEKNISE